MTAPKCLVVEDEFLIRMMLAEVLADEGFEVLEAGSSNEALAHLQVQDRLDLLITDIQIPGQMNGRALAEHIRQQHPRVPVIFMSGHLDALPPTDTPREIFIRKPYLPSEICTAAHRLLKAAGDDASKA